MTAPQHRAIHRSFPASHGAGFTLIESVTATGVFVLLIITVVNTFLLYSDAQRQSTRREKIVSEANFLLDQMAQEIRQHEIAYYGRFNYNNTGISELLYQVDVGTQNASQGSCESACTYKTDIYRRERELVLFDDRDTTSASDDLVIAYMFNVKDSGGTILNLCADESGNPLYTDQTGLYRFTRDGADNPVVCQRLFDATGLTVESASFWFSQPFNPYPDAVNSPTDDSPTANRPHPDCGPGPGASADEVFFNGYFCTCTAATQASACFSASCDTASGGRCTFGPNNQPSVTVSLTVRDTVTPAPAMTFQTTVAQRLYKR